MGYTIEFIGKFKLDKPLEKSLVLELNKLYEENLPEGMPESVCQWVLTEDKLGLEWDGEEKFYFFIEWLQYLIDNIFEPNNYKLSGKLIAEGEDLQNDISTITITNNKIDHKIFNEDEILSYHNELEENSKSKAGKILFRSRADIKPLCKWNYATVTEFLFNKFFRQNFYQNLVLVKEKSNEINLYNILVDELDESKQIKFNTLVRGRKYATSINDIIEIVHFNSFLHKKLFRSNQVYCICVKKGDYKNKNLILIENPKLIKEILQQKKEDKNLIFRKSNDLKLFSVIISKLIGGLAIAYITFFSGVIVYLSAVDLLLSFKLGYLILIILVGAIYYYVVIKFLFKLWYYVFPITIFRTKTISNDI